MTALKDKVVLITGASSGFGEDAARLFAREGCKVVLAARRLDRLQTLAAEIQNAGGEALAVPVDLNAPAEIKVMVQTALDLYGQIDILFNNAGYGSVDWFEKLDPERSIETIIKVNLIGTMLVTREVLPHMLKRRKGHIINMSSVAGPARGVPNRLAYSATKAAIVGLTKSVAADFVTRGIRCNAICPGTVETPSLHERLRATGDFDKALAAFKARQPMGRLGRPEEIAALAVYLASDESSFTTGQCHLIDGGWAN